MNQASMLVFNYPQANFNYEMEGKILICMKTGTATVNILVYN
jgi:hypothetical protein